MLATFPCCAKYMKEIKRIFWLLVSEASIHGFGSILSGHILTAGVYGRGGCSLHGDQGIDGPAIRPSFPKYTNNQVLYLLSFYDLH